MSRQKSISSQVLANISPVIDKSHLESVSSLCFVRNRRGVNIICKYPRKINPSVWYQMSGRPSFGTTSTNPTIKVRAIWKLSRIRKWCGAVPYFWNQCLFFLRRIVLELWFCDLDSWNHKKHWLFSYLVIISTVLTNMIFKSSNNVLKLYMSLLLKTVSNKFNKI